MRFFLFVVFFLSISSYSLFLYLFCLISERLCGNPGGSTQESYTDRGKAKLELYRDMTYLTQGLAN